MRGTVASSRPQRALCPGAAFPRCKRPDHELISLLPQGPERFGDRSSGGPWLAANTPASPRPDRVHPPHVRASRALPARPRAVPPRRPGPRKNTINTPIQVGKYLVSPLSRHLGLGRYAASVSIRSGRGSASHDRVLRLVPEFESSEAALRYATTQGLDWIGSGDVPSFTLFSKQG